MYAFISPEIDILSAAQITIPDMKVIPIPVDGDSYSYLSMDEKTREAAVIDCVDALQVLRLAVQTKAKLKRWNNGI